MIPDVERLAAELHAVYQHEARRQAEAGEDEVRHPDDYASLPEHTKEYDRVLARFILAREKMRDNALALFAKGRVLEVCMVSRSMLEAHFDLAGDPGHHALRQHLHELDELIAALLP